MKYRTIVADPPWDYGRDHERWPQWNSGATTASHKAMPYRAMSVDAICALPIPDLAEADSRLFLWTTSRYLPDAPRVIRAWGFEYRQTLVWRKTGNPSPFGGSVAPNHAEFLVVCQRGNPSVMARLKSSVIEVPATVIGHSRKPEAFLDIVETVSPGPYLELFARRNRLGWDTYGNEALQHVDLEAASD